MQLLDIDIDTLTPIEALLKLNEIKNIVKKKVINMAYTLITSLGIGMYKEGYRKTEYLFDNKNLLLHKRMDFQGDKGNLE